jgi:hypothetical protein
MLIFLPFSPAPFPPCSKDENTRKHSENPHFAHPCLVDNYLKSVDKSRPLDKIQGFLVGPVKFPIVREMLSWTQFLEFYKEFYAPGR